MAKDKSHAGRESIPKNRVQAMTLLTATGKRIARGLGVYLREDGGTFWPEGEISESHGDPAFIKMENMVRVALKSISKVGADWLFSV